jgi:hypothetical protein
MEAAQLYRSPKTNRQASALLGLLIVIALAAVVYLGQWWLKKTAKNPDLCQDLAPWKEWRLRQASENDRPTPSAEQPDITEGIEFRAEAEAKGAENSPRGTVQLTVNQDGTVLGNWNGTYYNDAKVNYDGNGDFTGYVCPAKIYQDENGQDPSKLYFITKGKFILHETDLKNKYHIRAGDIYVTGWINTDYVVTGKVTTTSDEKYSEVFDWTAYRPIR